jgi:hypothetical protein
MDIQDTIFDALVPGKEVKDYSDMSLFDLLSINNTLTYEDSVELTESILAKFDQGADPKEITYLFALLTISRQVDYKIRENLALVIDYSLYQKEEALEEIEKRVLAVQAEFQAVDNRARYNSLFPTGDVALDYLEEFFGDDLVEEIVNITGVSQATVKRYRKGHRPRYYTEDLIVRLAKIFYCLKEDQGKTGDQVVDFYKNEKIVKVHSGPEQSLADHFKDYHYFSMMTIRTLSEHGISQDIF